MLDGRKFAFLGSLQDITIVLSQSYISGSSMYSLSLEWAIELGRKENLAIFPSAVFSVISLDLDGLVQQNRGNSSRSVWRLSLSVKETLDSPDALLAMLENATPSYKYLRLHRPGSDKDSLNAETFSEPMADDIQFFFPNLNPLVLAVAIHERTCVLLFFSFFLFKKRKERERNGGRSI